MKASFFLMEKKLNLDQIESKYSAFAKVPYALPVRLSKPLAENGHGTITVNGQIVAKGTCFFVDVAVKMHCMLVPVGEVATEYGKEYIISFSGFTAADGTPFRNQSFKFRTLPRGEKDPAYPASICCNLYRGIMPHIGNGITMKSIPYITEKDGQQIVVAANKTRIVYKYFDLAEGAYILTLRYKSSGRGNVILQTDLGESTAAIQPSDTWTAMELPFSFRSGIQPLTLYYQGSKEFRMQSFCLRRR